MFSKDIYIQRRNTLKQKMGSGLIIIPGNNNAPFNYPANTYKFRQDSTFIYFFGHQIESLVGIIDVDNDKEYLLGDDVDIDDIIWYGSIDSISDLAAQVGVGNSAPLKELKNIVEAAKAKNQPILFTPPYRHDTMIMIADLIGIHPLQTKEAASVPLIKAIVSMRECKAPEEIAEIEKACEIGYKMHTTAQKECRPGVSERYIAGIVEGVACKYGNSTSFPTILSMHGEVQHGYPSGSLLESGRLMLCDAGAESYEGYASDNTRTTPISGRYTQQQRDIYSIVSDCHDHAIEIARPGIKWYDVHMSVARMMTERLKAIGLMKGDVDEAVKAGAHAMFFPHGLGHMMGMDVHDMENLGQIYVGFDDEIQPSTQFGTNCLRCGKRLKPGFVMTDEPGIYFIPALIDLWKSTKHNAEFINFNEVDKFCDFGGVRLEDDILITEDGCRVLSKNIIPYHMDEVEEFINSK